MDLQVELAIVGAGIYGSALAYFLSAQGLRVAVLEKEVAGAGGATSYSGGIVRVYDPDPVLAGLSLAGSFEFSQWRRLRYPGATPFRKTGCLYRVAEQNIVDANVRVEQLKANNYDGVILNAHVLKRRFPWLHVQKDDMAIWEPSGGYGDPRLTARNLAEGSLANGAIWMEHAIVKGFVRQSGAWKIYLQYGELFANAVVLAGGAYCIDLLPELPIYTRTISLIRYTAGISNIPCPVVDEVSGTYLRPAENGGWYSGTQVFQETRHPADISNIDQAEWQDADQRLQQLVRLPYLGKPLHAIKGFDAYTKSNRPFIGPVPGYKNVWAITGFSGRGYKYVLPVAKSVALRICGSLGRNASKLEVSDSIHELIMQCNS